MKCHRCKKAIDRAVRVFMKARDHREKDNFRDVCYECYDTMMREGGYTLVDGVWTKPAVLNTTK